MKLLVVCGILLAGCGAGVEPEFERYVKDFEGLSGRKNSSTVLFGDLAPGIGGLCNEHKVTVDRKDWSRDAGEARRRAVIYHELSHCNFGLGHSLDAGSYMNVNIPKFSDVPSLNRQVASFLAHSS